MSQLAPTQTPLAAQAPPGQPPGTTAAPPGAAGDEPPFEAAFDAELARTAPAEGQRAEQRSDKTAARRDRHNGSADALLAGAANAPVASTAANDSRSRTATTSSVGASNLSTGAVGTDVAGTQPPSTQEAASRASESIALGEQVGGSSPEATPGSATTTSQEGPTSGSATTNDALAAQPPEPSATSASLAAVDLTAPTAPSGLVSSLEAAEPLPSSTGPSTGLTAPSPAQIATQPQQPSSAPEIPAVGVNQSAQVAPGTTSRTGERTQTDPHATAVLDDKNAAADATTATGGATAQTASAPVAPSSGDQPLAGSEAEAPTPQHLADSTANAVAVHALDEPAANVAQTAPAGTLQTPGETSGETSPAGQGVALQQAVESLQATVELAARQGLTQARIQLHPAELGEIRIHLTQTSAGLLARVSAESSTAAQALIAAHGELRQSLSSLGIDLAQLHVGAHEAAGADLGQQGADGQQQTGAQQQPSAQTSGDRGHNHATATEAHGEETSRVDPMTDPYGAAGAVESAGDAPAALVDVLA